MVFEAVADDFDQVKADMIMAQIQRGESVNYNHIVIEGYLHLESVNRENEGDQISSDEIEVRRIPINSSIKITNSIVNGNANFDFADFKNEINFEGTNFTNDLSMRNSIFRNETIFRDCKFEKYANFWQAEFEKDSDFENAVFKGYADFRCSKFNKIAAFAGIQFNKGAKFYKSEFLGVAYFSMSCFNEDAYFGQLKFKDNVNFDYCLFDGYSDFRYAEFSNYANFKGAKFQKQLDLRDSIHKGDTDFQEAKYSVDFDIRGIKFSRLIISWDDIADYLICDGPVYLQLIRNFKNLEQFDDANSCYYEYRRLSMEMVSWSDMQKYLDALAWLTCGFGVRPAFTIYWMIVLISIFAILYWRIDIFQEPPYRFAFNPFESRDASIMDMAIGIFDDVPDKSNMDRSNRTRSTTITDAMIFSAALFFSLPPPLDYIRSRRFRILYVLEDIIGWLIMALFIVTLLNIIIRY